MKADNNVFHQFRVSSNPEGPPPPLSSRPRTATFPTSLPNSSTSPRPSSSISPRPSSSNGVISRRHHDHHHQQRRQHQQQRIIVFNGISANSWLFPIGIRHKDAWTANKDKRTEFLKNTLRESTDEKTKQKRCCCCCLNLCGTNGGDASGLTHITETEFPKNELRESTDEKMKQKRCCCCCLNLCGNNGGDSSGLTHANGNSHGGVGNNGNNVGDDNGLTHTDHNSNGNDDLTKADGNTKTTHSQPKHCRYECCKCANRNGNEKDQFDLSGETVSTKQENNAENSKGNEAKMKKAGNENLHSEQQNGGGTKTCEQNGGETKDGAQNGQNGGGTRDCDQNGQNSGETKNCAQNGGGTKDGEQNGQNGDTTKDYAHNGQNGVGTKDYAQNEQNDGGTRVCEQNDARTRDGEQNSVITKASEQNDGGAKDCEQNGTKDGDRLIASSAQTGGKKGQDRARPSNKKRNKSNKGKAKQTNVNDTPEDPHRQGKLGKHQSDVATQTQNVQLHAQNENAIETEKTALIKDDDNQIKDDDNRNKDDDNEEEAHETPESNIEKTLNNDSSNGCNFENAVDETDATVPRCCCCSSCCCCCCCRESCTRDACKGSVEDQQCCCVQPLGIDKHSSCSKVNTCKHDCSCAVDDNAKNGPNDPMTSAEFDSIWERVSQRPATAGKVFIVRRQKPPVGINQYEYLQGKSLQRQTPEREGREGDEEWSRGTERREFTGTEEGGGLGRLGTGGEETRAGGVRGKRPAARETEERGLFVDEDTPALYQKSRPFTAPRIRKVKFSNEKLQSSLSRPPRPFSHTGVRRGEYGIYIDAVVSPSSPSFSASEDLVVTSLSFSSKHRDKEHSSEDVDDDGDVLNENDDDDDGGRGDGDNVSRHGVGGSAYKRINSANRARNNSGVSGRQNSGAGENSKHLLRPKTASSSTRFHKMRLRQHDEESVDTIESIKRSYSRRAKSAPPGKIRLAENAAHHPSLPLYDVWGSNNNSGGSGKPSLYWRAKSAYHKKLMAFGLDDENEHVLPADNSITLRGSLWRPLMLTDEDGGGQMMQHGAGCPYKCKGCFKACLVSEDYLQKARAEKLLREKEKARQPTEGRCRPATAASFGGQNRCRPKVQDPQNLISIALAKSQPLYQMVHGQSKAKEISDVTATGVVTATCDITTKADVALQSMQD